MLITIVAAPVVAVEIVSISMVIIICRSKAVAESNCCKCHIATMALEAILDAMSRCVKSATAVDILTKRQNNEHKC